MTTAYFQTVQETAIGLDTALQIVQRSASDHIRDGGHHLLSCNATYHRLIAKLRGALRKAADTSDYCVNNIFTEMLNNSYSLDHKRNTVNRFVQSLVGRITAIQTLLQEWERLRNELADAEAFVQQIRANPTAISHQLETIIRSIRSIEATYRKISEICNQDPITNVAPTIQRETRWLTAVSADYKAFNPGF